MGQPVGPAIQLRIRNGVILEDHRDRVWAPGYLFLKQLVDTFIVWEFRLGAVPVAQDLLPCGIAELFAPSVPRLAESSFPTTAGKDLEPAVWSLAEL